MLHVVTLSATVTPLTRTRFMRLGNTTEWSRGLCTGLRIWFYVV